MSHLFGWDLPPGCTTRQIDEAAGVYAVCEVCGHGCDDCICPECPVCGEAGNPGCYVGAQRPGHKRKDHGMTYTPEQVAGREAREEQARQEAEAEAERTKDAP